MARIAGVDLPPNKRLWVGLTAIYGIGQQRARSLAAKANVDSTKKIKDLTEEEVTHLRAAIEAEGGVEGDLRKETQMNVRRLIEIQCYRGLRHRRNLPARLRPRATLTPRRCYPTETYWWQVASAERPIPSRTWVPCWRAPRSTVQWREPGRRPHP